MELAVGMARGFIKSKPEFSVGSAPFNRGLFTKLFSVYLSLLDPGGCKKDCANGHIPRFSDLSTVKLLR
jgi:hypothetical protein